MLDLRIRTNDVYEHLRKIVDSRRDSRAHVEGTPRVGQFGRLDIGCRDILDVHEVTGLLAVSEDNQVLAGKRPCSEDRKHVAVRIKALPFTVNIEVTKTDALDPM